MKICAIIPARLGSTRMESKPLVLIDGKAMVVRVCEGVKTSEKIDRILVATDDQSIKDVVEKAGFEALMTSADCASGTDRVCEALDLIEDQDVIVNVQGDEPLIAGDLLDSSIDHFLNSDCEMGTIASDQLSDTDYQDPDKVKVVVNKAGEAIYFSRAMIPFHRDKQRKPDNALLHIGVYLYRPDFIRWFNQQAESDLEKTEKLEQLRALENGKKISVKVSQYISIGVDVPSDVEKVEQMLKQGQNR